MWPYLFTYQLSVAAFVKHSRVSGVAVMETPGSVWPYTGVCWSLCKAFSMQCEFHLLPQSSIPTVLSSPDFWSCSWKPWDGTLVANTMTLTGQSIHKEDKLPLPPPSSEYARSQLCPSTHGMNPFYLLLPEYLVALGYPFWHCQKGKKRKKEPTWMGYSSVGNRHRQAHDLGWSPLWVFDFTMVRKRPIHPFYFSLLYGIQYITQDSQYFVIK
jgi:hypothetical protein